MASPDSIARRHLLAASLLAPLAGPSAGARNGQVGPGKSARVLVACFSRTGNTLVVAGQICRAVGGELFEIEPAAPYPLDYAQTVEQARRETASGHRPALKAGVARMASYDTVFLGFPIWGMTAPPVIRAFLAKHDFAGKTLIPFITHGGYGAGDSQAVLAAHAPRARLRDAAFVMQDTQEKQTLERVTGWLEQVGAGKGIR